MSLKRYINSLLVGAAVVAAVFSPGCESVETDLTYKIVPYLDLPDVDTLIPYSPWTKVFVHIADTSVWQVDSWEDARQGIITAKDGTGERRDPEFPEGRLDGDFIYLGPFTSGPVMLVAYDSERHDLYQSKMYGWRQVDIQPGIGELRIPVIFVPEKRGDTTKRYSPQPVDGIREVNFSNRWFMANDNPYVKVIGGDGDEDDGEDGDDDGDEDNANDNDAGPGRRAARVVREDL